MTYRGHIQNGQIMLDDAARLPEGARVNVEVIEKTNGNAHPKRKLPRIDPIRLPGDSLGDEIVRERR